MALQTIVKLPSGAEVALDSLPQRVETRCDGCLAMEAAGERFLPARIVVSVPPELGEGSETMIHLCGRPACQMSAFARRVEALWPEPPAADLDGRLPGDGE